MMSQLHLRPDGVEAADLTVTGIETETVILLHTDTGIEEDEAEAILIGVWSALEEEGIRGIGIEV